MVELFTLTPGGAEAGLVFFVAGCALHASRTLVTQTWDDRFTLLLAEGCALHASRTLVTQTWDHRALARSHRERITLICTILAPIMNSYCQDFSGYGWEVVV